MIVVDDHRAQRQIVYLRRPQKTVTRPDETSTEVMALGRQPSIEFVGHEGPQGSDGERDRVPVGAIGVPPAHRTRAMPGRQRDGVVEKKDGRPPAGRGKRKAPAAELGDTSDPQRASVVTHHRAAGVDQASAVTGEQPASAGGVQITPRVDPIQSWHRSMLSASRWERPVRAHEVRVRACHRGRKERPVSPHDGEHRGVDFGYGTKLRGANATTEAKLPPRRPHRRDQAGRRTCGPLARHLPLHDEVGADQRHGRVVE
jgi:hypothetical protein